MNYAPSATQTRTLTYTSLGRLQNVSNPESGTTSYSYYAGGSLYQRMDARGTTMTIGSIDLLKRPLGKTYSGTFQTTATPAVTYCYDGKIYQNGGCVTTARGSGDAPFGQMTGYGSQVDGGDAAQNYLTIDSLGRVLKSVQRLVPGATGSAVVEYPFLYAYQASGALLSVQYPISNRIVNYTQTSNRDVTTSVASGATTYFSSPTYTAPGALSSALMGSTVVESRSYNGRGQMTSVTASKSGSTVFGQALQFGQSDASNNGSVWKQTITAGTGATYSQYYRYDSSNRLSLAAEGVDPGAAPTACPGGATWCQRYGFDVFSNIWQVENTGSSISPALQQNGPSWYQSGGVVTNRLTGVNYDSAGNQTQFPEAMGWSVAYDAENRMTSVTKPANTVSYFYDGEGRRVKKTVGSTTTAFVYDADGQLMQEYGGTSTAATRYLVQDHLGSTRVVTDGSGNCLARLDYLPFGALVPRSGNCYGASDPGATQQFTGKERDAETGLDYFGARYMSAAQGRFTSPDVPLLDQQPGDPQSWNLYSYVRNNPLIFSDPTGNDCVYVNSGGSGIDSINNQNTSKDCGKTGGYWVDGTVTNARFAYGSLILTGTTNGQDRTSASYGLGPDPGLLALQRGTQLAEPGVNLAAEGLRLFGYVVAAPVMAAAECAAGAPSCTKANIVMAMLPEIAALKAGGTLLKLGVATGRGAEILQKAGGAAQAAKDFAALGGTEVINGGVRIRTLSDGTRAVLYTATSTGEASIAIQEAGRTVSKIRY